MNNFTQDLLKSIILLAFLLTSCIQKVDKKSKSTDKAEEAYRTCAKDVYSSSSADLQAKQVFNNFMQFIEHFPKYESQDITDSIFRMETPLGLLGETHLIPDSVARQYIPMNEAEKEITDIVYCHYGQRIEFENFYALFFTKFIDLHDLKKPGYEYIARSIVTYSKDGRIIECKDVVKEGDLWRYEISGKSNPFMLLAKQHYIDSYADDPHAATPDSTKEYSFTFNESGNIIRERLSCSDSSMIVSCALQENRTLVFWNEDSTLQGEDKYLRLDYVKGHLQSGILCATSDEIEEAREGYPCGFFALPLSHIKNHGDTIYFSIVMPRGENFYRARPFRISPESGLIKPDSDELWENEDDWEHNYIPYLVKYGCQDTISIRYKMYMKGDSLLLYNTLLGNNYGSSGHITFKKMNPLSQSQ